MKQRRVNSLKDSGQRMIKKRTVLLLLAAFMAIALLAGCQPDDPAVEDDPAVDDPAVNGTPGQDEILIPETEAPEGPDTEPEIDDPDSVAPEESPVEDPTFN
jgi:hypothetical protein